MALTNIDYGLIFGLITNALGIAYVVWRTGRWAGNIETRLDSLEKIIDKNPLIKALQNIEEDALTEVVSKLLYEHFESEFKANPLTEWEIQRRQHLTSKLQNRTITYEESQELNYLLEKELQEARERNNPFAVLLLLFLIGLVLAFLDEGGKS